MWRRGICAVVTAIAIASPAAAQNLDIEDSREQQKRSQEEIERVSKAADRARVQRLLDSGGDVTFQDVLRDPDNVKLNYRFAQTQIRDGNIRGASATLERILLVEPNRPDVRLLYAVVLFRLDNLQGAERELLAVRDLPMSASLKAEVDGFLSEIQQRKKRLRFDVLVNFGGQYDWNGNSAPRSGTRMIGGFPFELNDADRRHREFSANGTIRAGFDYDLALQRRHSINGAVTAYRSEHLHEDQLDLEVGAVEAGASLAYEPVTFNPKLSLSKVRLAHFRYLTIARAETETLYQASKKTILSANVGIEDQHFNSVPVSTTANEREGRQIDGKLGGKYLIDPTIQIGGYVGFYDKNAKEPYNAYHRYEYQAESTVLLTGGRFLLGTVTYQKDSYKAPDTFTSDDTRNDWSVRAKLTFGFPVSNLFDKEIANFLTGLTATVSVERFHAASNIPDYEYRNTSISAGFSRRWVF